MINEPEPHIMEVGIAKENPMTYEQYLKLGFDEQNKALATLWNHPGFQVLHHRMMESLGTNFSLTGHDLEVEVMKSACIQEGVKRVFEEVSLIQP